MRQPLSPLCRRQDADDPRPSCVLPRDRHLQCRNGNAKETPSQDMTSAVPSTLPLRNPHSQPLLSLIRRTLGDRPELRVLSYVEGVGESGAGLAAVGLGNPAAPTGGEPPSRRAHETHARDGNGRWPCSFQASTGEFRFEPKVGGFRPGRDHPFLLAQERATILAGDS